MTRAYSQQRLHDWSRDIFRSKNTAAYSRECATGLLDDLVHSQQPQDLTALREGLRIAEGEARRASDLLEQAESYRERIQVEVLSAARKRIIDEYYDLILQLDAKLDEAARVSAEVKDFREQAQSILRPLKAPELPHCAFSDFHADRNAGESKLACWRQFIRESFHKKGVAA